MNPSQNPRSLFFTPRTPWGRFPQKRASQNYLRASEDVPVPPASKRPSVIGSGSQWFGGLEGDKTFGSGEPVSGSVGLGLHLGNGKPATGENPHEEADDWTNERLHVNEDRTNRERAAEESASQKSPGQQRIEQDRAARDLVNQQKAEEAIRRFRARNGQGG